MTRIYTRKGDTGETSLLGGARVPKDDPRVAAYGDVDETNACIGLVRLTAPRGFADELLGAVQRDLFTIGGALAAPAAEKLKDAQRAKVVIPAERIAALEAAIDEADKELPALKAFVLPGGTAKAAVLHHARTVCRRAERAIVALAHTGQVPADILVYMNRLSDLLFTLARQANERSGVNDVTW
ncbi:MAG: cob(I)yrinic acid a,c-diamide adenosyltransferase [Gemmatimonadales bacterium]